MTLCATLKTSQSSIACKQKHFSLIQQTPSKKLITFQQSPSGQPPLYCRWRWSKNPLKLSLHKFSQYKEKTVKNFLGEALVDACCVDGRDHFVCIKQKDPISAHCIEVKLVLPIIWPSDLLNTERDGKISEFWRRDSRSLNEVVKLWTEMRVQSALIWRCRKQGLGYILAENPDSTQLIVVCHLDFVKSNVLPITLTFLLAIVSTNFKIILLFGTFSFNIKKIKMYKHIAGYRRAWMCSSSSNLIEAKPVNPQRFGLAQTIR